jgi:hypothetical protein
MKKLYKTTIIIWTETNPIDNNISPSDLCLLADDGNAYNSTYKTKKVNSEKDKDWDGTEFFD